MTALLMVVGGSLGAVARFVVSTRAQSRWPGLFPVGTATVNMIGSFLIGFVVGAGEGDGAVLAIGFLGGFTTFSTWMIETVTLGYLPGKGWAAVLNIAGIWAAGVGLAALGYWMAG